MGGITPHARPAAVDTGAGTVPVVWKRFNLNLLRSARGEQ